MTVNVIDMISFVFLNKFNILEMSSKKEYVNKSWLYNDSNLPKYAILTTFIITLFGFGKLFSYAISIARILRFYNVFTKQFLKLNNC